jgi:hypothetical protein
MKRTIRDLAEALVTGALAALGVVVAAYLFVQRP